MEKKYENFSLGPLNIGIPSGFVTAIIGENGAGKSTSFYSNKKSIALSKTNWINVIVFAVLSLVLMFISNKRWIKYLGELYDKE